MNEGLKFNELFRDFIATIISCGLYHVEELSKDGNYTFVIPSIVSVPEVKIEVIIGKKSENKLVSVMVSCGELKSAKYYGKTIWDAVKLALYDFLPVIYSEGNNLE